MNRLFCFGLGYSARCLARRLAAQGWRVGGTARTREGADAIVADGFDAFVFDGTAPGPGVGQAVAQATHVLVSAPPDADGDPVLRHHAHDLERASALAWIGYLSTIGVYGDRDGGWVDEATAPDPSSERSRRRVEAENAWLAFGARARRLPDAGADLPPRRHLRARDAARSSACARARRRTSSSPGRSSTAFTSPTSRKLFARQSRGAALTKSTMSPTTSRRPRRTSSRSPPSCCTSHRRLLLRWRTRDCRRWLRAFMPRANVCVTRGCAMISASISNFRVTARAYARSSRSRAERSAPVIKVSFRRRSTRLRFIDPIPGALRPYLRHERLQKSID